MKSIDQVTCLRQTLSEHRRSGQSIAFVPTMGNLHDGHIKLIHEARRHADIVVASIFVNPLQFSSNEDLGTYPRTLTEDTHKLQEANCDYLFTPTVAEMYPRTIEPHTLVSVPELSDVYCGRSRPGHFRGVATVVCKLFNMVQADVAVFGLKDYQQFLIITRMVEDLCIPIRIIGVETQREASGLALSSRNTYLDPDEKIRAAVLFQTLRDAAAQLQAGATIAESQSHASASLLAAGCIPDYFAICDAHTLAPATMTDRELVIIAAVWMGKTRLIDNIRLQLN
jgi:pantoate--beta-alanine ligase